MANTYWTRLNPGVIALAYQHDLRAFTPTCVLMGGRVPLTSNTTPERFGDYSGAAFDPAQPDTVWVSAEYGTAKGEWGIIIAHLTLDRPGFTVSH